MSYRSKKTFLAVGHDALVSENKQGTSALGNEQPTFATKLSVETSEPPKSLSLATSQPPKPSRPSTTQPPKPSSLATTQPPKPSSLPTTQPSKPSSLTTSQPPKPPFDPFTNKWGPFNPPTLGASQTFGYISEPIKPSMAAKNITKFTLSPSMKAHVDTSSQQPKVSQQSLNTPQHSTVFTTGTSLHQQGKVTQSSLIRSQQQQTSMASQQQRPVVQKSTLAATGVPHQQQQQRATMQQPPHKRTLQPVISSSKGTKPPFEKQVATAPMGATRPVMSRTSPTVLEPMALDKNPNRRLINKKSASHIQSKVSQPYMHVNEDAQHKEQSSPSIDVECELRQHRDLEETCSESEDLNEGGNKDRSSKKAVTSRPRHRTVVPDWPDNVTFDEKEEAVAYDSNGNRHIVRGPVQPRDVWIDQELRYRVEFNVYNQPLGKGGSILVSFLGDVAKREAFCPVGELSWHKLKKTMKADIVTLVRKHFEIPNGELFDKAVLKRTSKYWKNYRYYLKEAYFDPVKRTKEQNYENRPDGISKQNWTDLVDYWYSPDFLKLSKLGKDARGSQAHVHFSGATSFANRRADLEKEKGKFSEIDFYKSVYTKKDGSFKEGTLSRQFMEDANTKIKENLAGSSKSRIEIENEVFNDLMYQGEVPKRPLNYGFGVKQSDIFGVQGLLRKDGSASYVNHNPEVENLKAQLSSVHNKFDETVHTFKMIASQFAHVLKEVRNGNSSKQLLDGAESAINLVNSQIPDVLDTNGKK